ncbi:hypothetical protein QQ056_19475 [Oscillatoria laete-virens NRMC-F 0139]|nr:hypothetical protein [Oscillatoria laete-virens]MDL5055713.1 hypothetical protein [Oscillatoria laete-virens NRMC-F 0139]
MKSLAVVLVCIAMAVMGLGVGYVSAPKASASAGSHGAGEKEPEGEHKEHGSGPKISPQAVKNLGVETKEIDTGTFVQSRSVPAIISNAPLSEQPLTTPVAGTVKEVLIYPGSVAQGDTVAFRIVRDPLPRPTLVLTQELIKPAAEQFHEALGEVKRALRGVEVLKTELDRIKGYTAQGGSDQSLPLLPRKTEIDLRYELAKGNQELENAREKLKLHGLDDTQVKQLEDGYDLAELNNEIWQRALKRNGLWPRLADLTLAALPEDVRKLPWTIAAIGELSAAGLANQELADWLKARPEAGSYFVSIAGLIQQGSSLEHIDALLKQKALSPIVEIKVPNFKTVSDWDVTRVLVKFNDRVEAGAKLAELADRREMVLKAEPVGSDMPLLLAALENGTELEATPLILGSGPDLKALRVLYTDSDNRQEESPTVGLVAYLRVPNTPIGMSTAKDVPLKFRSWKLRNGLRYQLRVPLRQWKDVIVLPAESVTDDGADKVVYVRNGDSFESKKVVITYQDHEVIVLDAKNSDVFSGDEVVVRGAFGLGLAMKAGTGAADPHAGHSH